MRPYLEDGLRWRVRPGAASCLHAPWCSKKKDAQMRKCKKLRVAASPECGSEHGPHSIMPRLVLFCLSSSEILGVPVRLLSPWTEPTEVRKLNRSATHSSRWQEGWGSTHPPLLSGARAQGSRTHLNICPWPWPSVHLFFHFVSKISREPPDGFCWGSANWMIFNW